LRSRNVNVVALPPHSLRDRKPSRLRSMARKRWPWSSPPSVQELAQRDEAVVVAVGGGEGARLGAATPAREHAVVVAVHLVERELVGSVRRRVR
jgi:hypothetical protein